jgi:hypothetical protein
MRHLSDPGRVGSADVVSEESSLGDSDPDPSSDNDTHAMECARSDRFSLGCSRPESGSTWGRGKRHFRARNQINTKETKALTLE